MNAVDWVGGVKSLSKKVLLAGLLISLVTLIAAACSEAQREALQTLAAQPPTRYAALSADEAVSPVPGPTQGFSSLITPTSAQSAAFDPLGTLTAVAVSMAVPTQNTEPYVIENTGKPHFIEFHAWWWSSCNAMRSSVGRLEELYQDRITFDILNIDHPSSRDLVKKYQVTGIPFIVLLDANGGIFKMLLGYQTEEQLTAVIEDLLTTAP
jgi:thiol-disulfide isomerase/thioredoxin